MAVENPPWIDRPFPRVLLMGSVFRKSYTKPVPKNAEIIEKGGQRLARWRARGKLRTAPMTTGDDGGDRILIECRTYFAKYRDHTGNVVTRQTGCRDEQSARHLLSKWEREVEQIKAGTLDAHDLDTARKSSAPLEDHLVVYERSLVAAEVSDTYRGNVLRAVRKVAGDCGFKTPSAFNTSDVGA